MTLVYLAAAWVAGIAFADAFHPPWQLLPVAGFASVLALLLQSEERIVRLAALSVLTFSLGAGRLFLAMPRFDDDSLAAHHDAGRVVLEGVVVGEPDERDDHTNLRLRAERLTLPDGTEREVKGVALVRTARYPRRAYGDRLRVAGLLRAPPEFEDFSYREYLARQGIHSYMPDAQTEEVADRQAGPLPAALFALKRRSQEVIAKMLPEPQAALLSGILLGVEAGIPEEVMNDFRATGTSHIIAISGFNVTIVCGVFAGMAGRLLHRRRAILVAIVGVTIYAILVGASPSVVRAALMGALYLFARYVGRKAYAPVSLAAALLAMTAWNPYALWDRGFQLSFAATAGLLFFTEPLENLLEGGLRWITSDDRAQQIVGLASEALLVTIAVGITTAPLLLASFGRLSPMTLLSNGLILPAQSYVMVTGGVATVLSLIVPSLGQVAGWVAWLFLTYTLAMVRLTADVPVPSVSWSLRPWTIWGYYVVLGTAMWWLAKPAERRRDLWEDLIAWLSIRLRTKLLLAASGVLLALAFFAWRSLPDGRLHVHVLDVGQGDAIFVETPTGRQALVDGGPSPSAVLSRLGRRMPFWDHSLDLVVLTHPDDDHITGLVEVLERYSVDTVMFREMGCQDPICERWRELLTEEGPRVLRAEAGLEVALDEAVRLEVLQPAVLPRGATFNESSVVTRLRYGDISLMLTGDIESMAEGRLLESGVDLESTVLKVAHHGGRTSSTKLFVEAVDPKVAVISVGEENDFGHPHAEVLERLKSVVGDVDGTSRIYRTDLDGTVEMVSDGERVWVRTER